MSLNLNGVETADARYLCGSWAFCYICHILANISSVDIIQIT